MRRDVVIVGAGPAGLAAAYEAANQGAAVSVFESLDVVGGLARTIVFEGNRFDIGPHRFFTKNAEVRKLFTDLLGEDAIRVTRLTRILNNRHYFDYPLTPFNAMLGVGLASGLAIIASYAAARLRAARAPLPIETFEDWIVDRFGRRLFETFFKVYTEKVWGISCSQISADWAAQRIKGLSLASTVRNAVFKDRPGQIKTLVDEFIYPRLGAGQVYEIMVEAIENLGGEVTTGAAVCRLRREGNRIVAARIQGDSESCEADARFFLVSAPITDLVEMVEPAAPESVRRAARALRYREHVGVNLLIKGRSFPDNWLYVHSEEVGLARIANYRNFSPDMAASEDLSPLTVEYFASPGDQFSSASDVAMTARAIHELCHLKLIERDQVQASFVVRNEKAYPLMEVGHQAHVATIKAWLDQIENLLPIGRAGMFKYNNQDHAMATGLLAARTALGLKRFDPWRVNIDAEYHESAPAPTHL
jgi:protoporphyrinogen oxidase